MNRPYVKQFLGGELLNPINGAFVNRYPNRRTRRGMLNKGRATNNKKGIQLVVTNLGRGRFWKTRKYIQTIGKKRIVHYVEC